MESETAEFVHDAVAGVGAAVIADDHIGLSSQIVDQLALAFVAPVTANNSGDAQSRAPFRVQFGCAVSHGTITVQAFSSLTQVSRPSRPLLHVGCNGLAYNCTR